MSSKQRPSARRQPFVISPPVARVLSVLSIGALWAWFFLKFSLGYTSGNRIILVGSLAFLGVGGGLALFASRYLNQAYVKDSEIDERELAERNHAYRYTLYYILAVLAVSYLGIERLAARQPELLSPGVLSNYITVLFFTTVAFTPAVLAWWDRGEPDEE